jgi:hypothetical protein
MFASVVTNAPVHPFLVAMNVSGHQWRRMNESQKRSLIAIYTAPSATNRGYDPGTIDELIRNVDATLRLRPAGLVGVETTDGRTSNSVRSRSSSVINDNLDDRGSLPYVPSYSPSPASGMSTGTKVALGIGGLVLLALVLDATSN